MVLLQVLFGLLSKELNAINVKRIISLIKYLWPKYSEKRGIKGTVARKKLLN